MRIKFTTKKDASILWKVRADKKGQKFEHILFLSFQLTNACLGSLNLKELNQSKTRLDELQDLAKRIIQTDILFQKYSSKEQECDQIRVELTSSKA